MLLDLPIGIRSTKYLHYSGDKHHNIRGHITEHLLCAITKSRESCFRRKED